MNSLAKEDLKEMFTEEELEEAMDKLDIDTLEELEKRLQKMVKEGDMKDLEEAL